jgi:hypothetical protein
MWSRPTWPWGFPLPATPTPAASPGRPVHDPGRATCPPALPGGREKRGLAYAVSSDVNALADVGLLEIHAAVDPSRTANSLTLSADSSTQWPARRDPRRTGARARTPARPAAPWCGVHGEPHDPAGQRTTCSSAATCPCRDRRQDRPGHPGSRPQGRPGHPRPGPLRAGHLGPAAIGLAAKDPP